MFFRKFAAYFQTMFLKNISEGLLLERARETDRERKRREAERERERASKREGKSFSVKESVKERGVFCIFL